MAQTWPKGRYLGIILDQLRQDVKFLCLYLDQMSKQNGKTSLSEAIHKGELDEFQLRLVKAMSEALGGKSEHEWGFLQEFAAKSEIHRRTLSNFFPPRNTRPSSDVVAQICEASGVSSDWLIRGLGQMKLRLSPKVELKELPPPPKPTRPPDLVEIPFYDVLAGAGGGAFVDVEPGQSVIAFDRVWLRNAVGIAPEQLNVIGVAGDSMSPTLNNGDLLMVDRSVFEVDGVHGGVFVLNWDDQLLVKRCDRLGPKLKLISDNELYPPEIIDLREESDSVSIVGRVVWFMRRL